MKVEIGEDNELLRFIDIPRFITIYPADITKEQAEQIINWITQVKSL